MKFQDMPYARVTPEELAPKMAELTRRVQEAADPRETLDAFFAYETLTDHVDTATSLSHARFTLNTEDPFYTAENDYYDENAPRFTELRQNFCRALAASAHRPAMEKELGELLFRNIDIELTTFSPAVMPDLQEENRLVTAYTKLLSSAQIEFDGQVLNLSQMGPYDQSPNRLVRRNSCEAKARFFKEHEQEWDAIFDDLVRVRTKIALSLGFPSFVELAYARLGRNCYTKDDAAAFRQHIKRHVVPLVGRVKAAQAARIGLEGLTVYDDPLVFPGGNAKPFGTPEEIFAHGKRMYHELSGETAEFIDFMLAGDLFDVLARKGKSVGGYCDYLPDYKSPFIFANFNGTADDIDVLTHEAGHALAFYLARDMKITALRFPTYESCEIHSMSMEFFAWPWMEGFFGEQTDKYRYGHLAGALTFIPYGAMVDAFQHAVYERPDMTPAERKKIWLELETEYRPWLDLAGVPFYSEGGRWQAQSHIYEVPFYYIDYCLAQTVALALWAEMLKDRESAWVRYMGLVKKAGTRTFTELVAESGLALPFDDKALASICAVAADWLEWFDMTKLG